MTWASIATALLKLAGAVANYMRERQLLDAGRAVQRDKDHEATRTGIDRGRAAGDAHRVPDSSEFRD